MRGAAALAVALLLLLVAFGDSFKFGPCSSDVECEDMEGR
jgi:hypothetical protein